MTWKSQINVGTIDRLRKFRICRHGRFFTPIALCDYTGDSKRLDYQSHGCYEY